MIKQIFLEGHRASKIAPRKEYKLPNNINDHAVFSVDCIFKQANRRGSHCDEFIFSALNYASTGIHIIERKTNSTDATKVKEQLQGGANFIENFIKADPAIHPYKFEFMPVWVSKDITPSIRRALVATRISLLNRKKSIRHIKNKQKLPSL